MRRLSRTNRLRIGIIGMVTGIIVLVHWGLTGAHRMSPQAELIIGIVLVVVGLPFLIAGIVRK